MSEHNLIKISVRNLVEFILREGDIDNRISSGMVKDVMQQGSRIHRKIQKRMGADYQAEVSLKIQIPCNEFLLQVEGRADGIQKNKDGVVVDEIKGVLKDLNFIEQPSTVHLAQAKCYAYILSVQENLKEISVQMTYCNLETEELKQFLEKYSYLQLEEWFLNLVKSYEKWAQFQIQWMEKRRLSIKNIEFPFVYRGGQRDLVTSVYRTILRKKKLFIQAPTGVGKTMAAVFPAVKAIGEELGDKIFYLTAKTITRTVAEQAFSLLKEQGLKFKVITLTAKDKICFCEETICNPEHCSFAKGHYDRVNDAVYDMIKHLDDMNRSALEKQARKYNVCPFELALDVSLWMDAVICDYNYVFDPNAHLKRFFSDGNKREYLFLIDEAHNLVERGREMYSAVLYKEDILEMKNLLKTEDGVLARRLDECNRQFLALKRECETYQILDSVSHIAIKLMNVMSGLEEYLEKVIEETKREQVLDFYFKLRDFLNIHEILDENYVVYSELEQSGSFKIKLLCVNPSVNLQAFLEQGNSTIFFSATLLPIHYYKKLLSVENDDYAIYAKSSFPKQNRLVLMGTDVSTRYTQRGIEMYQKFSQYIVKVIDGKAGNYMIFFPSYLFMDKVFELFQTLISERKDIECIVQSQSMGEEEREHFLKSFKVKRAKSLVGFCVMGGVFSEGIDLTADRLIGTVIIGTGLPQVCNDREILKHYFDSRYMQGFDYAYLYPGMNKVLQSAGRVIRTETDKGLILLLDERFARRQYKDVFPREWVGVENCRLNNIEELMKTFWENQI